jgi:hypothetical protein
MGDLRKSFRGHAFRAALARFELGLSAHGKREHTVPLETTSSLPKVHRVAGLNSAIRKSAAMRD